MKTVAHLSRIQLDHRRYDGCPLDVEIETTDDKYLLIAPSRKGQCMIVRDRQVVFEGESRHWNVTDYRSRRKGPGVHNVTGTPRCSDDSRDGDAGDFGAIRGRRRLSIPVLGFHSRDPTSG